MRIAKRLCAFVGGATLATVGALGVTSPASAAPSTVQSATTVTAAAEAIPVIVTFRGYAVWSYADAYYDSLLSALTTYEFSNGVRCSPNGPYREVGFGDPLYNNAAAAAGNLFQVAQEYTCQ
ncbi:hypothetical protein [Micromonospora endolithica]|uniref:Uncharacterized protein n=1 Tax=Micromonospora endolithica TaxID=230091 RepID=A0A3A9ZNR1_9ACTN|nr:hypothetical protein [Micromonospora endolithica]RKN49574.1 hypothetical protein D7223_08900 [Micromonospora endolithica]TWJ23796.1 hypothetical protein JD76_03939 [Micromonospora endolithica]